MTKKHSKNLVVKKENALVVQSQSAENLISKAIDKKVSVETLERLFELDKKWKADRAREAYLEAMSGFQGECPVIKKTKSVMNKPEKGGGRRYSYAPLDVIINGVGSLISKFGLSYTITVIQDERMVEAKVKVSHIAGHSEESSFKVPIDPEAYMSQPQKYAAALTFAKRYAFCNAFGILTGDDDTDAVDVDYEEDIKTPTSKGKNAPTPRSAPKTGKETTEEAYQKVVKMLSASQNVSVLIDYSEKLSKTGCGFDKEQVKQLQDRISERVGKLEK